MLKSARASERVLKIAKGLQCPACDHMKGQKPHRVAKAEHAAQFNQIVALDTFEIKLPWRKLKMLNIVDMAPRYQMVVPMWKGADARRTRVAYRRFWKRWAGAPVKLWTEGGSEFAEVWGGG